MSNHETFVQYMKIGIATIAMIYFTVWASKIIALLQIIAEK